MLKRVERKTTVLRGLEQLSYEEGLHELDFFSLERKRIWEVLTAAFQYLKGELINRRVDRLFIEPDSEKTGVNGFKLQEGRLRLSIRKRFFS